jgi:hypothetical protein
MSVYIIIEITIKNNELYSKYVNQVPPVVEKQEVDTWSEVARSLHYRATGARKESFDRVRDS